MGELFLDPEIILSQERIMTECLFRMEEGNNSLLEAAAEYSKVMQDNVQKGAVKIVNTANKMLEEIKEEIEEKLAFVKKASKLQTHIESEAENR